MPTTAKMFCRSLSILLLLIAAGRWGHAAATTVAQAPLAVSDSVTYLTVRDSVMLEIAPDQRKYTRHVFTPRQTVYSLSRFYAQDIDQVYALNPSLATVTPSIGDTVRVAVPNVAITRFRDSGFRQNEFAPVCYRIAPGETMYHVARTVFRMPVDTLLALNHLSSPDLSVGQVIQVGWMSLSGAARFIKPVELTPLQRVNAANAARYAAQAHGRAKAELRRGVATFTPGTGDASGQLFALYNDAPVGSYLRVGHAADERAAYVRIIGRLPANIRRDKVNVVVSGTAAKLLGAATQNFYVTIQ